MSRHLTNRPPANLRRQIDDRLTWLSGAGRGAASPEVRTRIDHIDALRGLALLGVIVMNIGSMVMFVNARHVLSSVTTPEVILMATDLLLMFGKARSAFAFLFGAGFAILLQRAAASGAPFQGFYTRRLLILLVFGLVNQVFLFSGDILITYSVLGFVLLGCRSLGAPSLLRAGLVLIAVPPLALAMIEGVLGHPLPNVLDVPTAARMARGLTAYSSEHYLDAVRENIRLGLTRHLTSTSDMIVGDLAVLGLFMLGAWSVRTGVLTYPRRHAHTLRRVARWAIPLGLVLSVINMTPMLGLRPEGAAALLVTASTLAGPVLALGYLSALALLFSRGGGWLQSLLSAAGRMALTNYLLSGAIGTWVFYGYGLGMIDDFGVGELTLFGVGLFLALALFSRFWLSVNRHGPVEWVWRRLAYRASGSFQALASA